jgi:hypothetical protein
MFAPEQQAMILLGSYLEIESPLRRLKYIGFPMRQVSIIGQRDNRRDMITGISIKADGNAKTTIITQGIIVNLVTLVGKVRTAMIPELGAAMVAGKLADTMTTSLINTLLEVGVPIQEAEQYNHCVSQGSYLVIVEESRQKIDLVKTILDQQGEYKWNIYDQPAQTLEVN